MLYMSSAAVLCIKKFCFISTHDRICFCYTKHHILTVMIIQTVNTPNFLCNM